MSVINQMLKDLDGRQTEQTPNSPPSGVNQKEYVAKSPLTLTFLALILIVLIVIAWQLIAKQTEQATPELNKPQPVATEYKQVPTSDTVTKQEANINHQVNQQSLPNESRLAAQRESEVSNKQHIQQSPESNATQKVDDKKPQRVIAKEKTELPVANVPENVDKPTTVKPESAESHASPANEEQQAAPSLSISHKKLSPEALVAQKMQRVEMNIYEGDTKRAESLLEEVLLIEPNHHIARKQLAALWFGRQDYNAAHNLLAQGIALKPASPEFRLMKARIYLKESKVEQAVETLLPLSDTQAVDYQSVLATAAQQIKRHAEATDAFKKLTMLEPTKGRWWLGFGASLDSQGEFEQAKVAYRQALLTSSLSDNAQQFIRQRLTALGE